MKSTPKRGRPKIPEERRVVLLHITLYRNEVKALDELAERDHISRGRIISQLVMGKHSAIFGQR